MVAKNKDGQPLKSRAEALELPGEHKGRPDLVLQRGSVDPASIATETENGVVLELKEWQAIMDYLAALPKKDDEKLPIFLWTIEPGRLGRFKWADHLGGRTHLNQRKSPAESRIKRKRK